MKVWEYEDGKRFLVRVDRGEEIMETLRAVAREKEIEAAWVSGIGALRDAELGFFDLEKREYLRTVVTGSLELISLTGNIALREGAPVPHVHVLLGDADLNCKGGHLFSGVVSVTGELFIDRLPGPLHREIDREVDLPLLDR